MKNQFENQEETFTSLEYCFFDRAFHGGSHSTVVWGVRFRVNWVLLFSERRWLFYFSLLFPWCELWKGLTQEPEDNNRSTIFLTVFLSLILTWGYVFIDFRERGREGRREGETETDRQTDNSMRGSIGCLPLHALTGDWTHNLSAYRTVL